MKAERELAVSTCWSRGVLAALMLMAAEFVALAHSAAAFPVDAVQQPTNKQVGSSLRDKTTQPVESACHDDHNARDIVVCGQRGQTYRVDPDVMEANRQVEAHERSATTPVPPAQAICSRQPVGPPPPCGEGLGSLDLVNVAIVVANTAVRAAKGEDWKGIFRRGGRDEYQLYREAKRQREAEDAERAAMAVRAQAREAERKAHESNSNSR